MNETNQTNSPGEDMKNLLKRAVTSEQAPPHLRVRIAESIRLAEEQRAAHRGRPMWIWSAAAVAAAAMLAVGIFLYKQDTLPDRSEQASYIAAVTSRVGAIMRVGLGDHIHCAIFRRYPKRAPAVAHMKQELTPGYAGLLAAVERNVPAELRVVEAHKCRFEGRGFVHLVLKNGKQTLSVVVAARQAGETFDPQKLVPGLGQAGIAFYQEGTGSYQVAAFEAKNHLVYVISDLPAQRNLELIAALAGDIKDALPNT
jgi:hypothetical protein